MYRKNKLNPLPPSLRRPLRTSCCPAVGLLDAGSSRPWPELSEGLASDRSFTHDHQLTSATHSPTTTQVLTVYKILLRRTEAVHDLGKTARHGWDVSGGQQNIKETLKGEEICVLLLAMFLKKYKLPD